MIPAKFYRYVFAFIMSAFMTFFMSFVLTYLNLGFALSLNAADLTDTCKSYFSDIDKMVEAYKKAGQDQQVKIYEDQKKQSMDQLAALPKEQQDATCKQAKEMFAQVMDQMKKQGLLK